MSGLSELDGPSACGCMRQEEPEELKVYPIGGGSSPYLQLHEATAEAAAKACHTFLRGRLMCLYPKATAP